VHFEIRKARRSDLRFLVRIEQACFDTARYKWVMSPKALRHHIDNQNATFLVCTGGPSSNVSGYALALTRVNSRSLRFCSLAVLPGCQGRGAGRRLIEAVEKTARDSGHASIILEIREDNRQLLRHYLALGYVPKSVLRSYHPDGGNALRLTKELAFAQAGRTPLQEGTFADNAFRHVGASRPR
jgi:ribosomal protein S18 acetylase RimI-like enzyme